MCRRYYITPISAKKLGNEALEMVSKKIGINRPAKVHKPDKEDEEEKGQKEDLPINKSAEETAKAAYHLMK